jgi:phage gpG-like protein
MKVYIETGVSGPGIEVQSADGLNVIANVLESMASRGMQLKPVMGSIGNIIIQSVHKNFEAQGRPGKWQSRSSITEKIYAGQATDKAKNTKRYQNAKKEATKSKIIGRAVQNRLGNLILGGNGELKNSIVIGRVTNGFVEVGSSLIYSRIHQLGGIIRPKNAPRLLMGGYIPAMEVHMPARPYLSIQNEDVPVMAEKIRLFIIGGTR